MLNLVSVGSLSRFMHRVREVGESHRITAEKWALHQLSRITNYHWLKNWFFTFSAEPWFSAVLFCFYPDHWLLLEEVIQYCYEPGRVSWVWARAWVTEDCCDLCILTSLALNNRGAARTNEREAAAAATNQSPALWAASNGWWEDWKVSPQSLNWK